MTLKLLPTRTISLSSTLSHLVHPQCGYNARTVHFPLVLACHAELPIGCYFPPLNQVVIEEFLNLGTIHILGWMTLCCGGAVSLHFRIFISISDLYPLDTQHIPSPNW